MSYRVLYEQKLELTKKSIIEHCKECISNNWEQMFDMWLSCEAGMEFGHVYIDNFKIYILHIYR